MLFLVLINFLYVFFKYVLFFKLGMKKNVLKYKRRKVININIKIYFFLSLSFDLWIGIGWKFLLWWVGRIVIFEEFYVVIMGNVVDIVYLRVFGIYDWVDDVVDDRW